MKLQMLGTHGSLLVATGLLCAGAAVGQDHISLPVQAIAEMRNSMGDVVGNITLEEGAHGVTLGGTLDMMPPGTHAIHIHQNGACVGPAFETAGAHFNVDQKKHGPMAKDGPHAGDLQNFTVDGTGHVRIDLSDTAVTLAKNAPNSLLKTGGTALVIHAGPDDYKTDPSGASGARIACGVIQLKNPTAETKHLDNLNK
jgi:superoxide dismutase, Cu-Zn family